MISILSTAPIGDIKPNQPITDFIAKLKTEWDVIKGKIITTGKVTMGQVFAFLVESLDNLIKQADNALPDIAGPDKKATVLAAIAIVYDYAITGVLPIWLRPFSSTLKQFVIFTVFSFVVDWIVSKYNEGSWNASA